MDSRFNHLIIPNSIDGVERAAILIRNGGIVAFPTETVYGLGANALNERAVNLIFEAKGRPLTDPLIVHVSDLEMAAKYFDISDSENQAMVNVLAEAFWPGPLTIIAKASSEIPLAVTAGTGYVGIRCPAHSLAIDLIRASGLPIAAPSANRFGHVSPTRAEHVLSDLGVKGVHVLYGDDDKFSMHTCEHGIESTVLRIEDSSVNEEGLSTRKLCILRQGAITHLQLENTIRCNDKVINPLDWQVYSLSRTVSMHPQKIDESHSGDSSAQPSGDGQVAPGQAITHYSPDVPSVIITEIVTSGHDNQSIPSDILVISYDFLSSATVVIDFHGQLGQLQDVVLGYRDLSVSGDTFEAARNLFDYLRWAELVPGASRVLLPSVISSDLKSDDSIFRGPSLGLDFTNVCLSGESDILLGLADRIFRAASGKHCLLSIS